MNNCREFLTTCFFSIVLLCVLKITMDHTMEESRRMDRERVKHILTTPSHVFASFVPEFDRLFTIEEFKRLINIQQFKDMNRIMQCYVGCPRRLYEPNFCADGRNLDSDKNNLFETIQKLELDSHFFNQEERKQMLFDLIISRFNVC